MFFVCYFGSVFKLSYIFPLQHIAKTATVVAINSSPDDGVLRPLSHSGSVVKVAVEPVNPSDLPKVDFYDSFFFVLREKKYVLLCSNPIRQEKKKKKKKKKKKTAFYMI